MMDHTADPIRHIRHLIESFVRESTENRLAEIDGEPIFEAPLVGVAAGDDPIFEEYKSIVGPFHLTPAEVLAHARAAAGVEAGKTEAGVSVVCWVLPVTRRTRLSNRREREVPSRRWAHTRHYGEKFNEALRRHVVRALKAEGYLAVAPVVSSLFKVYDDGVAGAPASNWSERHMMYAAGLGTFGLSDGLITPRGMAMRCGSVVTNLPLPPTPRPYENHTANCLHLSAGLCGKCIKRCPVGAISEQGHDKVRCREYSYGSLKPWLERYQVASTGCGLCQTGVPCESMIPRRRA